MKFTPTSSQQTQPKQTQPKQTQPGPCNVAVVRGVVTRGPQTRTLPSGALVAEFDINGHADAKTADSVPVSVADPNATVLALEAGANVTVIGRVSRRFYRSGGATVSRTEILAHRVLPQRLRRRTEKALASVIAEIDPIATGDPVG